ncbi:hypothetical protein [Microbacterium sp. RU33B]|uniref:hypothetical protein n=1 Tax=Microbacterium sp. RU33B TaxID=1907390 RepID=UPI0011804F86|nr:hypothetical protein [Microbacterium sp. RU33B]
MSTSPDDATAGLLRTLVDTMDGPVVDREGWESFALILEFPDGAFNEAHGYVYSPDGVISAVACDPWLVAPAVKAYTDGCYPVGDALPRKILVQFDRATGRYMTTFEETDEARWKATPRTFRELREELRPTFD